MKVHQPTWCIAITFADKERNSFITLGGAGWQSKAEWDAQWAALPASTLGYDDPASLIADKLDQDDDLIDDKPITAATAEMLLRRPITELIAEAQAKAAQADESPETLLAKAAAHEACAERLTNDKEKALNPVQSTLLSVEALDQYKRADALRERAKKQSAAI
ncbi:TPA: hypothetical protein L4R50_000353 [Pseudomonas aeruginosa]|nr:hypothetical protein [Pseudomonas aeruginosa]